MYFSTVTTLFDFNMFLVLIIGIQFKVLHMYIYFVWLKITKDLDEDSIP